MTYIIEIVNYDASIKPYLTFYKSPIHVRGIRMITGLITDIATKIVSTLTLSDRTMLAISLYPFLMRYLISADRFNDLRECCLSYGNFAVCDWLIVNTNFISRGIPVGSRIDIAPRRLAYFGRILELTTLTTMPLYIWDIDPEKSLMKFAIKGHQLQTADFLWSIGVQISFHTLSTAIADGYRDGVQWIMARRRKCNCGADTENYFDRCSDCGKNTDRIIRGKNWALEDNPILDCCGAIAISGYVPPEFLSELTDRFGIIMLVNECYKLANAPLLREWIHKMQPRRDEFYRLRSIDGLLDTCNDLSEIYETLQIVEIEELILEFPEVQFDPWPLGELPDHIYTGDPPVLNDLSKHECIVQCLPYRISMLEAGVHYYSGKFEQSIQFRADHTRLKSLYRTTLSLIEKIQILYSALSSAMPRDFEHLHVKYQELDVKAQQLMRYFANLGENKARKTEDCAE